MKNDPQFIEHLKSAKLMFDQGKDALYIEAKLKEQNISDSHFEEIQKQLKRMLNGKKNKMGTQLILLGVLLLGIGFISSIILHMNGSTSLDFPLYGLTATGIVVLIIGLIYLFH